MSRSKYINTFYTSEDFDAYIESDLPEFPNIAYQKYLDHVEITMTKPAPPVWRGELSDAGTNPSITLDSVENTPETNQELTKFKLTSWSNAAPTSITINNGRGIKTIEIFNIDTSNVTSMSSMFKGCSKLTSVNLTKFNTSNVTNMSSMFSDCKLLTSLDLTKFNTSNVTNISSMFFGCSSLTSLDLTNFNTSNVTNMSSLFFNCRSLTSLDLTNFNTSNVTMIGGMFSGCSSLTSLDLSNFDTSKVTNMNSMFSGCSSLTSLDLSSFNTSQVTGMTGMFSGCRSLETLNLSNFYIGTYDTADTQHRNMFRDCNSLTDVYINNEQTLRSLTQGLTMAGDTSNEYRFIPERATIHFNSDPAHPEMIEDYMWSGSSWDPA